MCPEPPRELRRHERSLELACQPAPLNITAALRGCSLRAQSWHRAGHSGFRVPSTARGLSRVFGTLPSCSLTCFTGLLRRPWCALGLARAERILLEQQRAPRHLHLPGTLLSPGKAPSPRHACQSGRVGGRRFHARRLSGHAAQAAVRKDVLVNWQQTSKSVSDKSERKHFQPLHPPTPSENIPSSLPWGGTAQKPTALLRVAYGPTVHPRGQMWNHV